jgi:3-hydroxymyristoyl/3-hydroxydecanoyl-(acyl carrier protein) dehydratase
MAAEPLSARGKRKLIMEGMNIIQQHVKAQELFFQVQSAYYRYLLQSLTGVEPARSFDGRLPPVRKIPTPFVWDTDDLLEMTEGKISHILGDQFKAIDDYELRARLPLPPFLFVTRVTHLDALKGEMKSPASLTFEYDIPKEGLFVYDDRLLEIAAAEASHAVILLLSYMGCDFWHKGDICFRVLASTFTFSQEIPIPPGPGKTLEGVITIRTMAKMGATRLVSYDYQCRIDGIDYLTCSAKGGFFSRRELDTMLLLPRGAAKGKGTITCVSGVNQEKEEVIPFLSCKKQQFSQDDLTALCHGDFLACFNKDYVPESFFCFSPPSLLMIDRIDRIDREGGAFGLGEMRASYPIDHDHWVFQAHFKNDPVLPGTLMATGCYQLAAFYLLFLGWHKLRGTRYYSILRGKTAKIKFLGQVRPARSQLTYEVQIKSISRLRLECIAQARVFHEDNCVIEFQDFGVAFLG